MKTLTIKCGDSFSIWLKLKTGQTFPLNTNMLVYIGGVLIGNLDTGVPLITYESPYYKMNLSSEDTFPMRGYRDVIVVLDGTDGVRQVIIAGILFERLPTDYQTPTTNDGVNMIIELDVSTSPVTGSAELIDALKGDKGDPGYGVLPMDGAPGQVVTKLSYTEQDAGWRTPIQLGETSSDSYRGDRGKIAYDHSQTPHASADAEKNVNADWNSISGDSQILNKPTIPSITGLATTSYVDQQDALKVDKVTGKQLSTNDYTVAEKDKLTAIQAGAQVNKLEGIQKNGVDLTITGKNVNITVPTTAAEIGAQPAGTYATGTGTAYNFNTGDETLTSIKTTLGAATAVSDGYLKYQDFALLHTPTTVTASNGLSISGQNISLQNASLSQSGALTFNDWNTFNRKEPAITKNTAFNKNFGTTPGTVLEGRTFGTAANSAIGDFQPAITGLSTNYIPKWNGSSMVNSLISDDGNVVLVRGSSGSSAIIEFNNAQVLGKRYKLIGQIDGISNTGFALKDITNGVNSWYVDGANNFTIPSTTPSTAPTNGALVVGGGVGAASSTFGDNANPPVKWGSASETYGMLDWFSSGVAAMYGVSGRGLTLGANGQINMLNIYTNGNHSMGYTTDQGYKLAVNGNIKGDNYIGKSNGFYTVQITQADYTALGTKDSSTIYLIVG